MNLEHVWLGFPVNVLSRTAPPGQTPDTLQPVTMSGTTRYDLHELRSDAIGGINSIRETLTVARKSISVDAIYPLIFESGTPPAVYTRDASWNNPLGGAAIVLTGWSDGTIGGPYEIVTEGISGAAPVVSFSAEIGSKFEDLVELTPVPSSATVSPWVDLLALEPWNTWQSEGIDLIEVIRAEAIGATDAGGFRSALEAWGIMAVPAVPTMSYSLLSSTESVDPTDLNDNGLYLEYAVNVAYITALPPSVTASRLLDITQHRYVLDDDGVPSFSTRTRPLSRALRDVDPTDDIEISIPDSYNRPGAWRNRRLAIEVDVVLGEDRVLYASGEITPTHFLPDSLLQETYTPQIAFDRARWQLQNESLTTRVAFQPADLSIIPNQLLTFAGKGSERLTPHQWRAGQVEHGHDGNGSYTSLDLTLWQGNFSRIT